MQVEYGEQEYLLPKVLLSQFTETISKELSEDLAISYVNSLEAKLGGLNQSPESFIENGKALHHYIGETVYGLLISAYVQWLENACHDLNYAGNVYFALRDAAPFYNAAKIKWDGSDLNPVGIYLNRPILGIDDEISGDKGHIQNTVWSYLNNNGIHEDGSIILADTGAWGTVVKAIKEHILPQTKLFPFFWYSHNPNIAGYINTLLKIGDLPEDSGEIINDSMECVFPQLWKRPGKLVDLPEGPEVQLEKSDFLSFTWGNAALEGVKAAAIYYGSGISLSQQLNQIHKLVSLSGEAKKTGLWTGVLPDHTPTWSKGGEFLGNWPRGLLP